MSTVFLIHQLGALRPYDVQAVTYFDKLAQGDVVKAHIVRPRSIRQHRMLFGMLNLVLKAQDTYLTVEDLLEDIKLALGHSYESAALVGPYADQKRPDQTRPKAKSIAFDAMGQDDFNAFMDGAVKLVCEKILPGVADADLRREIEEIVK